MAGKLVNKGDLASIFGIGERQFSIYQKEGMPYVAGKKRGVENEYNTASVHDWLVAKDREARGLFDIDDERAKLAREQTEGHRLKNQERKGNLLPLAEVTEIATRAAFAIRQKIIASSLKEGEKRALLVDINNLASSDYSNFKRLDEQDDEATENGNPAAE